MAAYRPYRNVLRALSLTPYGPGSFTEEAYVSFMAPYGPYKPYALRAGLIRALQALGALRARFLSLCKLQATEAMSPSLERTM